MSDSCHTQTVTSWVQRNSANLRLTVTRTGFHTGQLHLPTTFSTPPSGTSRFSVLLSRISWCNNTDVTIKSWFLLASYLLLTKFCRTSAQISPTITSNVVNSNSTQTRTFFPRWTSGEPLACYRQSLSLFLILWRWNNGLSFNGVGLCRLTEQNSECKVLRFSG